MGAVEHLKTLCCLGLKPESAMVAVAPVLHEIIPHGWSRAWICHPDGTVGSTYAENPGTAALYRERMWSLMNDPSGILSLYVPAFRAIGIGWALHRQGRGWLESANYREVEAPFDSCWILDAMIGDGGRTIAGINLTRPRSARPFTVDDVQRLDRLRPWLAHAFRPSPSDDARLEAERPSVMAGEPVRSGQMILTPDARIVFQTNSLEFLLLILVGEPANYTRYVPVSDNLPAPVLKLIRQITGAANGTSNTPPRMRISTAYGVLTLEAKWLVPTGTLPPDAAKDPKSCLISVTIDLHEHPIAHAARVLRESGATPTQIKVGIRIALGKPKPVIADKLGVQPSSVADLTRRLYQTLDVHNSAELGTKIWLGQKQNEARQSLRRAG
jgi:DNA-binding CsgD family transcriptional regulator